MLVTESVLLADRIVIAVRWVTLLGLSLFLAWGDGFGTEALALFFVSIFWNLILTVASLASRRLPYHEYVMAGVDGGIGALFFFLTGTESVPFFWAALLPLLTVTFYFGVRGGVIVSMVMALIELVSLATFMPFSSAMSIMVLPAVVYLIVGVVVGFAAHQFGLRMRSRRKEELNRAQSAQQLERDRIKAIYEITTALGATLRFEQVLDMALDLSANALATSQFEAGQLVSAFCLFDIDNKLHIGSCRRFPPGDAKAKLPGQEGIIAQALKTGESRFMQNPAVDPELNRLVVFRECAAAYVYPLRTNTDQFGVLLYGHPNANYFDGQRREILEIIGRQSRIALQNSRLYEQLVEEKERMMDIQEEARKKLARNLHDGPTQSVAAIAMRVNFARRLMEKDGKAAGEELYKIEDLARRTTKEIRHMLFTLRPLVLESSGLAAALESMAEKMGDTYEQNVIIEANQEVIDRLEMGKQGVIFYIAEEGVNNARKHAEAEHVWVRLKPVEGEDIALLEVQDDGVGFNVGAVDSGYENRGSLGMVNMRERTELLNGLLKLESSEGVGTRIRVWIPITEDAAEKLRHG